jgi:hypothetical protein
LEEPDIFPESASARMDETLDGYKETLCSASNGWVMDYFTKLENGGYTFLVKFSLSGEVIVAARNRYVTNYSTASSVYRIIADNGPTLSFATYNEVFHKFSNPVDPEGKDPYMNGTGLEGDYEFVLMERSNDMVRLKGKKRGTNIYLRRLPENMEWTQYYDSLATITNHIFNSSVEPVLRKNDEILFSLFTPMSQIFGFVPPGGHEVADRINVPFVFTDYGICLAEPYDLGDGITVQMFELNDAKDGLISKENSSIIINSPDPADFFIKKPFTYLGGKDKLGGKFLQLFEDVEAGFLESYEGTRNLTEIGFSNKIPGLILQTSRKQPGIYYVPMTLVDSNTIKIDAFDGGSRTVEDMDKNGSLFYFGTEKVKNVPSIKDMLNILPGTYKVEYADPLTLKSVKIYQVDNPDNYMIVAR